MSQDSCLVKRLSRYIELTKRERDYIASIEEDQVSLEPGQSVDDLVDGGLCVLNGGWAVSDFHAAGRRHITRLYLPGEIIGFAELAVGNARGQSVRMQTEGDVCRFPKKGISEALRDLPRLAALFIAISGLDQMTLRDRLGIIATSSAEDRLLHFLLDLRARLAVANVGSGNRFRVPMTQDEIGGAIGATSVTVNKLFRTLREEGRLEIDRPYYRLLDREAMERQIGFTDRYEQIDTSWFPDPS